MIVHVFKAGTRNRLVDCFQITLKVYSNPRNREVNKKKILIYDHDLYLLLKRVNQIIHTARLLLWRILLVQEAKATKKERCCLSKHGMHLLRGAACTGRQRWRWWQPAREGHWGRREPCVWSFVSPCRLTESTGLCANRNFSQSRHTTSMVWNAWSFFVCWIEKALRRSSKLGSHQERKTI